MSKDSDNARERRPDERRESWDDVSGVIDMDESSSPAGRQGRGKAVPRSLPVPGRESAQPTRPFEDTLDAEGVAPPEAGDEMSPPPPSARGERGPFSSQTLDADADPASPPLDASPLPPRAESRPERRSSLELLRPGKPAGPFAPDSSGSLPSPRSPSPSPRRPSPDPAPLGDPRRAMSTRSIPTETRGGSGRTRDIQARDLPPVDEDSRVTPGDLKFVIEQGLSINKEFLVSDPEMLIGRRDPDQDFIPDIDLFDQETATNRYISRRQARLFFKEGRLWVEDLDSSNGTAVNNRLITPHEPRPLKPGDKLLLGQSVLLRLRQVN